MLYSQMHKCVLNLQIKIVFLCLSKQLFFLTNHAARLFEQFCLGHISVPNGNLSASAIARGTLGTHRMSLVTKKWGQIEGWRIACKATLCGLSVVSQTQTTSVSLDKTSSYILGSSSLHRWVQIQFTAIRWTEPCVFQTGERFNDAC